MDFLPKLLKFLIFASLLVFLIPAHLYRVVYFDVLVEVMFLVYVWLLINGKIKLPKISLIGASFLVFIVVSALATIFSVEPAKSFWGAADRSLTGGLFMYLHYFLLLIVLIGVFDRKKEDYLKLFKITILIGVLMSAWGFYQTYTGLPRINSLMGNPTYLSNFLIFSIFLSAYLFFVSGKARIRFFYLGTIPVFLAGIYLALSRGPILGLLASIVLVTVASGLIFFKKNHKKTLKIIVPSVILILAMVYLLIPMIDDSVLLGRFKTSLTDASATTRMANWDTAFKAIADKPILGWGQENFDIVFYKYADSSKFLSDNLNLTWFDRAHNNILDIGVTEGVLGIGAYLLIWFAVFVVLFHLFELGHKKEAIIFSMFLIAYFVGNLLFFDSLVTFLPFIFVLAFLSDFSGEIKFGMIEKAGERMKAFKKYSLKDNIQALWVLVVIIGIAGVVVNVQIARASYYYYNIKFEKYQDFNSYIESYEKVLSIRPSVFREDATYSISRIVVNSKINDSELSSKIKPIIQELKDLSTEHPLDIKPYYYGAKINLLDFELSADDDALIRAQDLLEQAIKISPTRQVFYMDLARVKMNQGDFERAVIEMEKARDLNQDYSRPYFYLTVLYLLNNQGPSAEEAFAKAGEREITYDKVDSNNLLYIADYFISKGENDQAMIILEEILRLDEQNVSARKKAAVLYAEMGDKEKARKYAMIIWNIDVSLRPEAEDFIRYLDGK